MWYEIDDSTDFCMHPDYMPIADAVSWAINCGIRFSFSTHDICSTCFQPIKFMGGAVKRSDVYKLGE
jgi:hypothetical protein